MNIFMHKIHEFTLHFRITEMITESLCGAKNEKTIYIQPEFRKCWDVF